MAYTQGDYIEPSKGQLQSFTLAGTDLTQYVHCVRVYESVCKPYLTAQIIIYDTNNLIENLGVVAGDPSTFSFTSPPNFNSMGTYSANLFVLKMKGEQVPDTLKYQIYTLDLIGQVYYQDRGSTVQYGGTDITGTAAIQNIWNQYLNSDTLNVETQSLGMIGTSDAPYNSARENPLTCIYNIMKKLTSSQFQSGNWLLFRDRNNVNLVQLEQLLNQASATQEYFIQKETWGVRFNDADLYHGIIVAQAEAGRGDGGRGGGADIAATVNQTQSAFDLGTGTQPGTSQGIQNFGNIGAAFGNYTSAIQGLLGGQSIIGGYQITDSSRWANASAPFTKTLNEAAFSAMVKDGPWLTLKVPLQCGLNVTVGKGVYAQLCPPIGDLSNFNINTYLLYGPWLCTDLVHELYTDERESQGTTSMQLCKGNIS